jgi:probable HAF family extracellular repeat protein
MSNHLPLPAAFTLGARLCRARLWLIAAMFALLPIFAWTQTEYTVTDLGTLGGSTSGANAVNNLGQVVGSSNIAGDSHADPFLYSNGVMTDVWAGGTPFGAAAVAINDSGHFVVNYFLDNQGSTESYLWNGTSYEGMGNFNSYGGAMGINSSDTVVGWMGQNEPWGYWIYSNGQLNVNPTLGTNPIYGLPSGIQTNPGAINDAGMIIGGCQWLVDNGAEYLYDGCVSNGSTISALDQPANTSSTPAAIDAHGNTCGYIYNDADIQSAAYWNTNNQLTYLVLPPKFSNAECSGMDEFGDEVGDAYTDSEQIAVLWDPLNGARDLNTLVPHPHTIYHGTFAPIVLSAVTMSNAGYIAASCLIRKVYGPSETHACLLTPNFAAVLRNNIKQLAKVDPDCEICKQELEPEAKTLPESLTGLSTKEKEKVVSTVGELESQLRAAIDGGQITAPQFEVLLNESVMVLKAIGAY